MRHEKTAIALILAATGCGTASTPEARSANVTPPPMEAIAPTAAASAAPIAVPSGLDRVSAHEASASASAKASAKTSADAEASASADAAPSGVLADTKVTRSPTGLFGREESRSEDSPSAPKRSSGASTTDAGRAPEGGRPSAAKAPVLARTGASVRAGEWDDNANYGEYQKYLASASQLPFEKLDLSLRRFLVVRDVNGKGVVNCRVTVRDEAQHQAVLTTTASGRALLFPRALGLVGTQLSGSADCYGQHQAVAFDTTDNDGVVEFRMPVARPAMSRTIDLVFVLDTTGSMSEEIDAVKDTLAKVASEAARGQAGLRVAVVEYKDQGDQFVTRIHPFSTDIADFSRRIDSIQAGGGGDTPEHANEGLRVAIDNLDWNDAASARLAFLIGDAPPHLDYPGDAGYSPSIKRAAARGIQLYTVAASGMDALGQAVWRQIAQFTGGTNLFVLRGGAGPQSTGAGEPTSSCGGTQANYASGNLDKLILAKLELTQRLLDLDPLRIAGLHRDENAKPCDERMVLAQ